MSLGLSFSTRKIERCEDRCCERSTSVAYGADALGLRNAGRQPRPLSTNRLLPAWHSLEPFDIDDRPPEEIPLLLRVRKRNLADLPGQRDPSLMRLTAE